MIAYDHTLSESFYYLENAGYFFPIPRPHHETPPRFLSRDSPALMAVSLPPFPGKCKGINVYQQLKP